MKKIDIHVHTSMGGGINRPTGTTYATPEQLVIMYERLGVEKGVILPAVNIECMYETTTNVDAMNIARKYPESFSWFCNIDPRMGSNSSKTDFTYFIEHYKKLGAKGVGEICANLYFDDPLVENLFLHCEKNNMPVIFHVAPKSGESYGLVDELSLPRLEKELKKFPNLIFLGHSQPFWAEISTDVNLDNRNTYPKGKVTPGRLVELFRKYPNLCGDLSAGSGYNAITRDPEFGYGFIEEFQDRLYFGTDICAPDNDMKLSFWLDDALSNKKISENAYIKVCRNNALRLLEDK